MTGSADVTDPSVVSRVGVPRDLFHYEREYRMNLAELLTNSTERFGERVAIKLDDTDISYQMLNEATARVAGLLKSKGFQVGDRVGIMLPNVPYFPVVYYGVLRAGGVVVPMNPLLKGREVAFYLRDPEAKIVFAWHQFADAASEGAQEEGADLTVVKPGEFEQIVAGAEPDPEVVDRAEGDTAVILYTSGTTGTPKGAELTHSNLWHNQDVSRDLFSVHEGDRMLGALPLFHSFGQTCALNCTIGAGGMMSMIPRFDGAKALEIIQRDRITVFEGVPTMFSAMLHVPDREKYDVSALRICCSGGSAMPVEVLRGFEEAFGCTVLEGYGLSETSPVASFNHPD